MHNINQSNSFFEPSIRGPARGPAALVLLLLLVLTSCSVPPPDETREVQRLPTDAEVEQYNAQVSPEDRIVCRVETPVGSNIPVRRCYRAREIEEVGRFHREQLRNVLR
jgi:hypothetical protein